MTSDSGVEKTVAIFVDPETILEDTLGRSAVLEGKSIAVSDTIAMEESCVEGAVCEPTNCT